MGVKEELRKDFSRDFERHYKVELFEDNGFTRKACKKCGRFFWSVSKETCGNSACEEYDFFTNKGADYIEEWKKFEKFFVDNGHESVPRYPVICRWRDDLHFTIASIVDFMRLEGGNVVWEYPKNPLVVPQMCLRFNDIPNVGVTGRHFSCFIMAGQHAFNPPREGYWKDECLRLNYEFLTKILGIREDELTYVEDVWAMPDLSSFGPCIESFSRGLEIVNSVFMEFTKRGLEIKELPMKVIDVGWGFERIVWYAAGTPTAYDCCFGPVVPSMVKQAGIDYDRKLFSRYAKLSGAIDLDERADLKQIRAKIAGQLSITLEELNEKISSLEAVYAIADHSRALAFAIADGGLPSNVGGGYNLRVILRRALSFIDEFDLPFSVVDVAEEHARYLKPLFPELWETIPELTEIIETEQKRYKNSLEKGRKLIVQLAKQGRLAPESFVQLYESNGITPELVEAVASKEKLEVEIPSNFYDLITRGHVMAEVEGEKTAFDAANHAKTKLAYYETDALEAEAKIIGMQGNALVLDKTIFYPEGGGQAFDVGEINGVKVKGVQKVMGVVFHVLEGELQAPPDLKAFLKVDGERRNALRRHHSATHVLAAACRSVLGRHVWQAGAKKEKEKAHLDITHYEKITGEQLREIERVANQIVLEGHSVIVRDYERGKAESTFGFTLYQGGGSPGKTVRVVNVEGIDVEACGGLHVSNTRDIGLIKIIREERIQDGVNRIEFCAGAEALNRIQQMEALLSEASREFNVSLDQLPQTAKRFFAEWKERGKEVERLTDAVAEFAAFNLKKEGKIVKKIIDAEPALLRKIALKFVEDEERAIILANNSGNLVCAAGKESGLKASELFNEFTQKFGGSGGGNGRLAMGKVERPIKI